MSLPPRRRFQFRLSTWFVLVAILAWAMWLAPLESKITSHPYAGGDGEVLIGFSHMGAAELHTCQIKIAPKSLFDPALALAAFAAWKAAWAIVERRKSPGNAREIDLL